MASSPPAFANADFCKVCDAKFTLFNRRHHCRNCGISLCSTCSPYKDALPHFGLTVPERTCHSCHEYLTAPPKSGAAAAAAASCNKCFSPLCVCKATAAAAAAASTAPPKPKPSAAPRAPFVGFKAPFSSASAGSAASGSGSGSRFQSFGAMSASIGASEGTSTASAAASPSPASPAAAAAASAGTAGSAAASGPSSRYSVAAGADLNEQCREAIKNADKEGVAYLLEHKADANYRDRTGNTLLHVACIMDRFPIVQLLCDAGGNPWVPNALKVAETAVDVAPPALQFRIKTAWPKERFEQRASA